MMPRFWLPLLVSMIFSGYTLGADLLETQGAGGTAIQGTDVTGTVGLALTETDNIYRSDTSKLRDAIGQVFADLNLDENTRLIEAKAASNLSFLEFDDDDYPSELIGNFYGTGRFSIVPDRFSWVLQENFGQQQVAPGLPTTPANLQNINFVSTGPDVTVPIAGETDLRLTGRYSNVSYQTSELDNNRADGTFSVLERMSASSSLSANVGVESIRYQNNFSNPDFQTQELYLDWEAKGARTTLSIMAGADRVSGLADEPTQPFGRLSLDHAISPSSRLTLSAGQDYSDSGSMLRQLQELSGLSYAASQSVTSNDPFTERYGRLAWEYEQFRTALGFDVARYQEIHLVETQYDQQRWVADVNFRRRMTPAITATVQAGYIDDNYENYSAYSFKSLFESASLNWQAGKRLGLQLLYQHFGQSAKVSTDEFAENRVSAIVSYAVGRIQTAATLPNGATLATP